MLEDTPLMAFWRANKPTDSLIFKDAAWHQRDYFEKLGYAAKKLSGKPVQIEAIGGHTSKSVRFPVVEYKFENGASLVVRDNLYNFAVSVISPRPVPSEMLSDIGEEEETSSCYCEGFPTDKVYGSHSENPQQFTTHIWDHDLFSYFMVAFAKLQNEQAMKPLPVLYAAPQI